MRDSDSVSRFVFEHIAVRGALAHLDAVWQEVLQRRDYPPVLIPLLGQAMVGAALLHTSMRAEGQLSLQIESDGYLRLLVVQCDGQGQLRATARWRDDLAPDGVDLDDLCAGGRLALTVEPPGQSDRYQGVVELSGARVSDAIEHYFAHSEQLDTALHLIASRDVAAGFLLQRLPGDHDPDAWNRLTKLSATLSDDELACLDAQTLLHRLFAGDDIRLFAGERELRFHCGCTRQRTGSMLTGLGEDEVRSILAQEGSVEVTCEFCGQCFQFDSIDAIQLFGDPQPVVPPTAH